MAMCFCDLVSSPLLSDVFNNLISLQRLYKSQICFLYVSF